MFCDVFQNRVFEDGKQNFMSEQLFHIQLFFSALNYKSNCNTCWPNTSQGCFNYVWISHWKPGPNANMEIMKTGQLTVFVFDLVGVKRMLSLCKKLDKSCILGLKHLCLVLQLKPGAELTKTHYIPENIRNELQEVIT